MQLTRILLAFVVPVAAGPVISSASTLNPEDSQAGDAENVATRIAETASQLAEETAVPENKSVAKKQAADESSTTKKPTKEAPSEKKTSTKVAKSEKKPSKAHKKKVKQESAKADSQSTESLPFSDLEPFGREQRQAVR